MKLSGARNKDIAERLGVTPARVTQYLTEEMKSLSDKISDDAQNWVRLEVGRLDRLQSAIWHKAIGYVDGENTKHQPSLNSMDRVLRISQQRAELLRLISPDETTSSIAANVTLVYPDNGRGPKD